MRESMSIKDIYIVKSGDYEGYKYIVRQFRGYFLGYVGIPEGHRFFKKHYDHVNEFIDCHGGLTFADFFKGRDEWYIGFDCAHAYDSPSVQDAEYTEKECIEIIEQMINIGIKDGSGLPKLEGI